MREIGPGTVLAHRFVIEAEPLAEGGTATLWPAWDEVASRSVAVKVIHGHLLHDQSALARLQAEAGAASRLRHAHLLVVHGLWADEGRWLLAEERLDGPALTAPGVAPLSTGSTLAIGLQLVEALSALHAAGHVHGDVRPRHVVLADRGAVLLGFGQASVRGAAPTHPGRTAPEVAVGGPPGVPADVYGLGVTLHYALTGRLPFRGDSPWSVIGQQRTRPPERPPGPEGLARFLVDLMHPDPDRRPPSMTVIRHVLRRLQEDPDRRVSWRPWVAPMALGGAWTVHGVDPETGAPAVVRSRLARRRARQLVERLRAQGWNVRADPEGLTGWGLVAIALAGMALGTALPLVGLPLGVWAMARGLSARTRPNLSRALPAVRAEVPPRLVHSGTEYAIAASGLLLIAAVLVAVEPITALVPGVLLLLLVLSAWRGQRRSSAADLLRARVEGAFAELRHDTEVHALPLDDSLSILGETEALETRWRAGVLPSDRVLVEVEALRRRAERGDVIPEPTAAGVRDALGRASLELDRTSPGDASSS